MTASVAQASAARWWLPLAVLAGLGLVFIDPLASNAHGQRWYTSLWWLPPIAAFIVAFAGTIYGEVFHPGRRTRRWAQSPRFAAHASLVHELELGLCMVAGVYLLVSLTGGLDSWFHPLVYAAVAFAAVLHAHRGVALFNLAVAGVLELAMAAKVGHFDAWVQAGHHLFLITLFAVGHALLLRGVVQGLRTEHRQAMALELTRIHEEARDFRLDSQQWASDVEDDTRPQSRDEAERRILNGSVHAIAQQLFFDLELLSESMALHSCVVLWLQEDEGGLGRTSLRIKQIVSSSQRVVEDPSLPGEGVLAAVMRDPKPLRVTHLDERRVPPYYAGPDEVTDLFAVPIVENGRLSGILCADRREQVAFTDAEQAKLEEAARQVLRVVGLERAFAAIERRKYEQEQFYRASGLLSRALTRDEVCAQAFAAVASFSSCDLLVITSFDARAGRHQVLAAQASRDAHAQGWRQQAESLEGLAFEHTAGLVASAIKNQHPMPAKPGAHDVETIVFDAEHMLREARSLWVVPMSHGEEMIGTMVLASAKPDAYPEATRNMLHVIVHQVASSLQNARMYELMEERATTDGLTGLTNHRCFQERLEQLEEACRRNDRRFSLILTDIDHFKSVNDTYGHPVGDAVLRRVAQCLSDSARKIDIVARYGGEEFVVVLPDTDASGAAQFAERLRKDVEALVMTSEQGQFKVTLSLGVAEFPVDADARQSLIEQADQALYACKSGGRNQVVRWRDQTS